MSVSSSTSRIVYAGNNSLVTAYAVPFYFEENAHLNAIAKTAAGVETVVTLTNHTGAGNENGGTVRTAVAVPATSTLTIYREVPFTQATSYEENDAFPAASHEKALDKLTTITQQLERRITNCIRGTEATPLSPIPSPTGTQQFVLSAASNQPPSWQELPVLATGPVVATGSTQARFISDRFGERINVRDFGAVGDNVTDDTAAINAAIAYSNTLTIPKSIFFPSGFYKITAPLTQITSPTKLFGDCFRGTILFPQGNFDVLKFVGTSSRVSGCGVSDLIFDCQNMTGGIALTLDYTQDFVGSFTLANPWNGVYVRQSGNTQFESITIDKARGNYCFKAFGSNTTRNGENDQCDVIAFQSDSTFTGTYIPGGAAPITSGVILDGRVHTVTFGNLRLLSLLCGFVTTNTASLPQKFVPSFIYGKYIETENTYSEGVQLNAVNSFDSGLFIASVTSESGIKIGSSATRVNVNGCNIESCWKSGITISGAKDVTISNPSIYRNNLYSGHTSGFSAIEILSGDNILVIGGRCGKPSWEIYTEQQEWGIINVAATNVRASGVDLRSNFYGANSGDIYFSQCVGTTAVAPITVTLGASPYTYTAGNVPEVISVDGGTVSQISVQAVPLFTQTNQLFLLQPNQPAVITYSVAPTVRSLKLLG